MERYERKGRVWWLVGHRPYTRKDGSTTELAVWQSLCAVCATPFEVATPASCAPSASKAFEVVHCADHRLTKADATKRWLSVIQANRAQKNAR